MWFSAVCTSRPKSLEPQLNLLHLFIAQQFKARTCATKCLQQVLRDAIVILIRLDVDVSGPVHHSTIHKEKNQQDATKYLNFIIPYLYETQHVSGDTPPIIRSLKLHWQPLVFHT